LLPASGEAEKKFQTSGNKGRREKQNELIGNKSLTPFNVNVRRAYFPPGLTRQVCAQTKKFKSGRKSLPFCFLVAIT
jgi:hypothetical protein